MLEHKDETYEGGRPDIKELLQQLSAEGLNWAEAELALAKTELGELKGQMIKILCYAVLGLAASFSALVALVGAGIAFLTPRVDSAGVAALIAGTALLALVIFCFVMMRRAFSWRTESLFFRWLGRRPANGTGS